MDEEVIRVIEPLLAETGCLDCHDSKVGDPLAVVSVRYSLEDTNASLRTQTILATIIVVVCIVITFSVMMFLINKRIIYDIKRIIEALKRFAVGNVKETITTDRRDEVGDAVKSLRVLQNNLLGKAEVATEIAKGNLDVKVKILSEEDDLGLSMQKLIAGIKKRSWNQFLFPV